MRRLGSAAAALGAAFVLNGCSGGSASSRGDGLQQAGDLEAGATDASAVLQAIGNPFAPTAIRVHPLSHLSRTAAGDKIVCHVEMRDRWGDPVKGAGYLRVSLYRSLGDGNAQRELDWNIDLTDAETNAGLYHPVTQTYRVQLGGGPGGALPGWVSAMLDRAEGTGSGPRQPLEIRATLRTVGPSGRETTLNDAFVIER
ncbi:MAG: hypothetical protein AAF747_00655 [Planctomycetota bacterium]